MKLFRLIRAETSKNMRSVSFAACALLVALLCFTSNAYTEYGTSGSVHSYSVIELFLSFNRNVILTMGASNGSAQFLFLRGMGEYSYLFMPLIVSASFAPLYCSARSTGLIRFELIRSNKLRYVAGKLISAMFTGGCIVTAGYLLYGLAVAVMFPWANQFSDTALQISMLLIPNLPFSVLLGVVGVFLYGAVSVLPAFFFCFLFRNPYVISCLPFVLIYIKDTSITRIIQEHPELESNFVVFRTYSIRNLPFGTRESLTSAAYLLLCTLLVFLACWLIEERRLDSGA